MAISRKKQEALTNLYNAEKTLCDHRGIPYDEYKYTFKGTISEIIARAKRLLELANEPLPQATDKQIKFLEYLLSKDYNKIQKEAYEAKKKEGKLPNRFQVSELISELKSKKFPLSCDDLIYGHYNVCQEEFAEIENKLNLIISMI